jgi:DNA recombination protein RmuC
MTSLIVFLAIINIVLVVFLISKTNKTDFSFLTTEMSQTIRPLADKLVQLETILVQRFESQKEITKLQVSEIIEEKFKKITAEQNKSTQDIILHFSSFQQAITSQFVSMNEKINKDLQLKLNEISDRVKENLDQGFKKTNETFNNVVERLAKIDEAQKKIESLSANVVSLQDV